MVASTFDRIIDNLIDVIEQGYVHRSSKADPGGPTNYGITLTTFRAWHDNDNLNRNALMIMPKSEAKEIYKVQYWDAVRGDELPLGLDWAVFDFAVNSGPGRAVMSLQEVLKVKQDAIIGVNTMRAIRNYPGKIHQLITDLSKFRLDFMKGLSNWRYNKNGWTKRVKKIMSESQALITSAKAYRPDMVGVEKTPKASSQNVGVSKALLSKENVTVLTVAIPAVSGLLSNFQPGQYAVAAFVAGFGCLALYWGYRKVKREAI